MDTITQALLGAACANVCGRRALGKRAARWGAVGGALPDLDIFAGVVGGPWIEMQYHRGVSHALWFGPVVGSAIGWILWRRYARLREREPNHEDAALGAPGQQVWWMLVLAVSILSHPLLDLFTSYGTQLFAPFSDHRFAINAIGIIDPVYTLPLIAALTVGPATVANKRRLSAAALVFTTSYLLYGAWLNDRAEALATASLEARSVTAPAVTAYPRIFQIFQRRLVGRGDGQLFVGQVSMFAPRPIDWHAFTPADTPLVAATRATAHGELFEWFAMRQTAARSERQGDETIVEIDDLRYGDPAAPELGMWGIRARFRDDELVRPVERFRRPQVGGAGAALSRMLHDTFSPP